MEKLSLVVTCDEWSIYDSILFTKNGNSDDTPLVYPVAVETVPNSMSDEDLSARYDCDYCGRVERSYNPSDDTVLYAWFKGRKKLSDDLKGNKIMVNGKPYFTTGSTYNGFVYKNEDAFLHPEKYPEDEVVYIPESAFEDGPIDRIPINFDTYYHFEDGDGELYTRKDFLNLCDGDKEKANLLFYGVDWQHPETLIDEGYLDDYDEED